jgi:hypothetical protein
MKEKDPTGELMLRAQVKADQSNRIQSIVKVCVFYGGAKANCFEWLLSDLSTHYLC